MIRDNREAGCHSVHGNGTWILLSYFKEASRKESVAMICSRMPHQRQITVAAIVLTLGLFLAPLMAQETMYRWTDEQGVTHYGQVPPIGVEAERITHSSPRVDRAPQERLERAQEAMGERRQQTDVQRDERAQQEAAEQQRRVNCQQARTNLETLTSRGQVTLRDDGEARVLPEEERQALIETTREQIREFCDH